MTNIELNAKIEQVAALAMGVDSLFFKVYKQEGVEAELLASLVMQLCDGCVELYKMS